MGAGRGRVVASVIAESLVLGIAGGLLGLGLAWSAIRLLVALHPQNLPRLNEIAVDGRTVLFSLAISLFAGMLFGGFPAWQVAKADLNRVLRESGRSAIQAAGGRRFRSALVVTEVALSLVLLTGASLLLRSFKTLQELNRGFQPDHFLTLRLTIPKTRYPDQPRLASFVGTLLDRLRVVPGVAAAAASTGLPLDNNRHLGMNFAVEGGAALAKSERPTAYCDLISPDYFKATGIPLLRGRAFTERDNESSPGVIIVSQSLAKRYLPGQNPIGRRLIVGIPAAHGSEIPREIVGVVGDVQYPTTTPESSAEIYMPYLQGPWPNIYLAIRTRQEPRELMSAVREQIRAVDREQAIAGMEPMAERIRVLNQRPQFNSVLASTLAALALILATVGIYGVISYSTRQRTQELGVRIALGASPRQILHLVLAQGIRLTGIGLAVGLVVYLAIARLIRSLLFGTSPTDVTTIVTATAILAAVAIVASYLPARRALRVDPAQALRAE